MAKGEPDPNPTDIDMLVSSEHIAASLDYISSIENYVHDNIGNLPLQTRGKIMAYFKQPSVAQRDVLAETLAKEVLEETKQSY